MRHRIYVSRAKKGLGYPHTFQLVKKAAAAALEAEKVADLLSTLTRYCSMSSSAVFRPFHTSVTC